MKCANCGKEFGNGVNCQNCGIDRVTGLANYSGYDSHAGSNDSPSYGGQTSPKTTVCYACNEIIPLGVTYCPVCGKKLIVTCPKCGHEYSSQYPVCSKCGTNRDKYHEQKVNEEQAKKEREEKERKIRKEAMILTEKLSAHSNFFCKISGLFGVIAFAAGLIGLIGDIFLGFNFEHSMSLIGLAILGWILFGVFGSFGDKRKENETQHNISRWKMEHPHDPRNKYL